MATQTHVSVWGASFINSQKMETTQTAFEE